MKYAFALVLALIALIALPASATLPKEVTTGYVDACYPNAALEVTPLWARNLSGQDQKVMCSARIDTSQNGTHTFGAVITNLRNDNRTVTCVAEINSGGNGVQKITRSVFVGPKGNKRIAWTAADMGFNKTFIGGQGGFTCTLPHGMAIQWIYTLSVGN